MAITSYDRLYESWAGSAEAGTLCHARALLDAVPRDARLITVIDGHPSTLAWLGGVCGHSTASLGVRKFGESGNVGDLYRINGIDADAIEGAVAFAVPVDAQRKKALPEKWEPAFREEARQDK